MQITPRTEKELNRFPVLPPGEYPFTIMESGIAISKSAKNAGKEMVKLKICVHGPDEVDVSVLDYFADWFSEWKLKHCLETTGNLAEYESGEINPDGNEWTGRTGRVKLVIEPATGSFSAKNAVDDYIVPEAKASSTPKFPEAEKDDFLPY